MGGHSATSGFSVPPSVAECLGQGSWGCTTLLQRATRNLLQYRPMHHSLPTLDPLNPRQPGGTTGQPGGDSDPSATPQEVPEREEEGEAGLMSSVAMPAAQVGPTPGTPSASPGDTAAAADSQRGRERGEEGAGAERGPVAGEVAVAGARVGGAAGVRGHPGRKKAAVLVVMFQGKSGELRVWLTKRSGRLRSHSGELVPSRPSPSGAQAVLFFPTHLLEIKGSAVLQGGLGKGRLRRGGLPNRREAVLTSVQPPSVWGLLEPEALCSIPGELAGSQGLCSLPACHVMS